MNERIKEFAIESGFGAAWFEEALPGYPASPREGIIKNFAELIVRECAEVSENYADGSMPLSIALAIKKHFGIDQNEPAKPLTYVEWLIRSPDITPEVIEDVKYIFALDDKEAKEYVLRKEYELYLSKHK